MALTKITDGSGRVVYKARSYSSYWLEDDLTSFGDRSSTGVDSWTKSLGVVEKNSIDLYRLASYKRAIGNFVTILAGRSIPVTFAEKGMSLTYVDPKTGEKHVIISSDLTEKTFDSVVGLSLHEGSHVLLSDFDMCKNIATHIPAKIYKLGTAKNLSQQAIDQLAHTCWNVIEDRFIDNFIYTTAPGYRGYYLALYDRYFNDKEIDKALQQRYTEETLESYMFRLINLTNANNDMTALKEMQKISEAIDLPRIGRLKKEINRLEVALEVMEIILNAIEPEGQKKLQQVPGNSGNGQGSPVPSNGQPQDSQGDGSSGVDSEDNQDAQDSNGAGDGEDNDEDSNKDSDGGSGKEEEGEDEDSKNGSGSADGKDSDDSKDGKGKEQKPINEEKLKKAIQKQKDFLDGNIKKKTLSANDKKQIEAISQAGTSLKAVGDGTVADYDGSSRIECVLVEKVTRELMENDVFPFCYRYGTDLRVNPCSEKAVSDGIRLGTVLGRKLQIRGEARVTKFTRQQFGKIDKRLINELGFGAESVFSKVLVDQYKKAHLHISVDASGSMAGPKWQSAMTTVVAICKAVDMIANLDVVVDIRGNSDVNNGSRGCLPYVAIVYNSKVDDFIKISQVFPYLAPTGSTPEGLCFEAVCDLIPPSSRELDSYFLNFSDGQPTFSGTCRATGKYFSYGGDTAYKHTAKWVNEIRKKGVVVSSYFIEEGRYDNFGDSNHAFRVMYGKDAHFINVNSIMEVARVMNKKFLEKNANV